MTLSIIQIKVKVIEFCNSRYFFLQIIINSSSPEAGWHQLLATRWTTSPAHPRCWSSLKFFSYLGKLNLNSHFKCLTKNNNSRRFRTKSKVNRERTVKETIDNSRYWLYSIMVYVLIFFSQHFSGSDLIEKKLNKRLSLVLTSQSLLAINYWSNFKVGKGIIGSMRQGKGHLQKKM